MNSVQNLIKWLHNNSAKKLETTRSQQLISGFFSEIYSEIRISILTKKISSQQLKDLLLEIELEIIDFIDDKYFVENIKKAYSNDVRIIEEQIIFFEKILRLDRTPIIAKDFDFYKLEYIVQCTLTMLQYCDLSHFKDYSYINDRSCKISDDLMNDIIDDLMNDITLLCNYTEILPIISSLKNISIDLQKIDIPDVKTKLKENRHNTFNESIVNFPLAFWEEQIQSYQLKISYEESLINAYEESIKNLIKSIPDINRIETNQLELTKNEYAKWGDERRELDNGVIIVLVHQHVYNYDYNLNEIVYLLIKGHINSEGSITIFDEYLVNTKSVQEENILSTVSIIIDSIKKSGLEFNSSSTLLYDITKQIKIDVEIEDVANEFCNYNKIFKPYKDLLDSKEKLNLNDYHFLLEKRKKLNDLITKIIGMGFSIESFEKEYYFSIKELTGDYTLKKYQRFLTILLVLKYLRKIFKTIKVEDYTYNYFQKLKPLFQLLEEELLVDLNDLLFYNSYNIDTDLIIQFNKMLQKLKKIPTFNLNQEYQSLFSINDLFPPILNNEIEISEIDENLKRNRKTTMLCLYYLDMLTPLERATKNIKTSIGKILHEITDYSAKSMTNFYSNRHGFKHTKHTNKEFISKNEHDLKKVIEIFKKANIAQDIIKKVEEDLKEIYTHKSI